MEDLSFEPLYRVLPSLDPVDAARDRALFRAPLSMALADWVPGLVLSPANAGPMAAERDRMATFGMLLKGAGAELWLQVPMALDTVTAAIVSASAWSPVVRAGSVLARARSGLERLIGHFDALGLLPVHAQADPRPREAVEGCTRFECRVGEHRIAGSLRCTDIQWLQRFEASLPHQGSMGLMRLAGLMVPLRLRWGSRRMSAGLLRSVETGDVVLLPGTDGGRAAARAGAVVSGALGGTGSTWRACEVKGHRITITGERWMNTAPNVQSAEDQTGSFGTDGGTPLDAVANIEVDVHFELEVLSTPLSELAAMRPGYVIELPVPAAEANVSLVVGGQVYGRAQLVTIGDRLGARITELLHVHDR